MLENMEKIKEMDKKIINIDDVLVKLKFFGRYHMQHLVWFALAYLSNSMYCSNYIFAAENIQYRCMNESYANNTCGTIDSEQCTEWVYDDADTFMAEFQIACQDWKRTLVGTTHSLGYMFGLLIVGPMSDRLGRKKALVVTGVIGGILGLAKSFSQWYWLYIALEFLESAIGDICSPAYVLNIEIVSKKSRVPYYMICSLGFCFGGVILPFIAWLVPYWRNYLRVIYAPALLFFLYIYLIDESPRWLLIKGKKDKAIEILEKAAKKNKIELDNKELDNIICEKEKDVDFGNLLQITFSSKALLKRFLVCVVWWTTSTFVNYGMTINSVSLEGNKYVNFALMSILDLPGTFVIMYVLIYFKRKIPLIASFFVGAVLCLSQPFMPNNLPWLSTVVYFGGKLMSSFYFNITYIYTSELFPTYTRNSMHALCSSLGRIGSILAPQTPLLMVYWPGLPSMIFGGVSLIAGLVTFLVPDTANTSLPDTVRQAEAVGNKEMLSRIGINYDISGQTQERNISVVTS